MCFCFDDCILFLNRRVLFRSKGVATGLLGTAATVAGAVFAVKKTIIEPEKKKLTFIEENRKKAARRRVSR